ncbi:phenylacetate-CoA ligase [Syntrophobotulus glycolicus DSM 8271]|uniref:Phenylacetate-coenzyme A ligase n=1 Tax=Syntrophobotulus glycolicus (strain DSM 8271 / FlGlyR) TaxID=645991 RepID=F0T0X9_SYNGF|nr:phenylacetate--CoA ligase [Syntrophobotulus glycolicus]ADY57350.1 phenylacetate-CoA ligase [Syntrophobotulus glycolicus DSM 8271]
MDEQTFSALRKLIERVEKDSPFYRDKFQKHGVRSQEIRTAEDFEGIPFTTKEELREAYPLGLRAVPEEKVVRIHSSSGTTGIPVVIPYSAQDVADWAEMMKRCYEFAGVTQSDRVQITPGYGLWTAGIGFQAGAELLGAMAVPTGPGNTDKQLQIMMDLKTTVLTATSSYALLIAEEVAKRGIGDQIRLRRGIFGSERWSAKMRGRISRELNIEVFDIYGLTEIYGPGISIDCGQHSGLHYWDDFLYFEVIDPETGRILPHGQYGELVITTLRKEAAPLVRFRTRDITRLIPGQCPCGSPYPRHDIMIGRSDDMVKVKGVNIFPAQIDEFLRTIPEASSEYQLEINHEKGRDRVILRLESESGSDQGMVQNVVRSAFKRKIGIQADVEILEIGQLPRSEKKTKRVLDNRKD